MKVLHVYKDYFPPVKGGIERHINLLATGLKKRGIEVEVLVSNTVVRFENQCIEGIHVTKVPQICRLSSAPLNIGFSGWLRKLGRDVDLVHFHFPNPTGELSYLCSGLKGPYVVSYHSDIVRQRKLGAIYAPFRDRFLDGATQIIAGSPNYANSSSVLKAFRRKICIIPYGIDTKQLSQSHVRDEEIKKIRARYGPRIILFVGRFRYYKGLHVMIEAMTRINASFLIVGNGPLKNELMDQVRELDLGDKITFLGGIPDCLLVNYLYASDIMVLPSVYRSEAFGIVLLEAMACGKPVISTELGTGSSFANLHKHTGLVVPPNNSEALVNAVTQLFDDPQLRMRMGENAKERVKTHFTIDKMVDRIVSVYDKCLGAPPKILCQPAILQGKIAPYKPVSRRIKVVRIISRLNIGGPAIHVQQLALGLNPDKFETVLVTGKISPHEGDMAYLFKGPLNRPVFIPELQREIHLRKDLVAFAKIFGILMKEQPDILHTHAAKAGTARLAACLYSWLTRRDIKIVHTFHGNVFKGYFSRFRSRIFIGIERGLSKITDAIVAVSDSQKEDLESKYRIADKERIRNIELGFNLKPFWECKNKRGRFRKSLGIDNTALLVGIIGRLVPIKNHLLFLDAAKELSHRFTQQRIEFVVVGDGEMRDDLEKYVRSVGLKDRFRFTGWIREVSDVYSDIDILALTSLNEGTPVSIIEAMAASVPVVATDAGGVKDLLGESTADRNGIRICEKGILCPQNDPEKFAAALQYQIVSDDKDKRSRLDAARQFVENQYSSTRLVRDIESLYLEIMGPEDYADSRNEVP